MIKDEEQDDGGLLSLEKLDRASPDLWPEKSKNIDIFPFLVYSVTNCILWLGVRTKKIGGNTDQIC